jgi:hypothetical protein
MPVFCEILRVPHCLDNPLKHGGEVVSFTLRPRSAPQNRFLALNSVGGLVNFRATVRLKGLGKLKKIQRPHQDSNQRPSG